ncbi:sperm-egg fusion protein TMEM95-like [Lithobates pipiens]
MWLFRFLLFLLLPPTSSGCVFCTQPEKNLTGRFKKLCEEHRRATNSTRCTRYPGPNSFNHFGLDEDDVFTITEKTHRVFRILEISRDRLKIAAYWDWLHEVKLVEYAHSVMCPPLCMKTKILYNCTVCRLRRTKCLRDEICYPGALALHKAMWTVVFFSIISIALGIIVFTVECWRNVMRLDGEAEKKKNKE